MIPPLPPLAVDLPAPPLTARQVAPFRRAHAVLVARAAADAHRHDAGLRHMRAWVDAAFADVAWPALAAGQIAHRLPPAALPSHPWAVPQPLPWATAGR